MNVLEQRAFVRELIQNVRQELMRHAEKWPAQWDGHELRALIARAFADAATVSVIVKEPRTKRAADFRNVLVNHDLW